MLSGCAWNPQELRAEVQLGLQPNQDVIALPEPEQVATAIDRLPGVIEKTFDDTGVPGMAVAVVHEGKTVYSQGFGVRESGTDLEVTPETVFQIASLSKPLSATGIAAAIGASDGALSWESPISQYMPNFAFSDPVVTQRATVGDAFSHRTGLFTGAGDDLEDIGYDRAQILERLTLQPLDTFRNSYHYSNFGVTIGAEAVAASRGQEWESLMDELVFEPIGMTSSTARYDDYLASDNRAVLHAKIDGEFVPRFERDADPQAPAGGVASSVADLAEWMNVLLHEGESVDGEMVADADALRQAMTPHVVSGAGPELTVRPSHYGFGFNASPMLSGRMAYSHSGAFVLGAGTAFQVVPELDLGIVVLTNGAPVGAAESVVAQFFDMVQFGEPTRDWTADFEGFFAGYLVPVGDLVGETPPSDSMLPSNIDQLLGEYQNSYFGDLILEREGDVLLARLGPDGVTQMQLTAWDGGVLAYAPSNENAPDGSLASATFTRVGDDMSVTLESFDAQGLGTWTKKS
tara:strand:+ start:2888 stop:4441 length:1554 start_codon:yes stop_codon:yes gene_type:complete